MFTEIAGFTALMQSDQQLAIPKRDTSVLQEEHEAFGGTIVQFFGDGSLSTFPTLGRRRGVCDRSPGVRVWGSWLTVGGDRHRR